ncbi:MAG: Asp-tRNA(Asn)/Glu-tRNA(Gln) amidotransferase subunit GatB, partial [Candidatus Promineifilaceae bacterium]
TLPELPDTKLARYTADFGLTDYEASVLTEERPVAEWFEAALATGGEAKSVSNWMLNVLFSLMNEHKQRIEAIQVMPAGLVSLIDLVDQGIINSNTAKDVLAEMFVSGRAAEDIVAAKGLAQISDEEALADLVRQVLAENPEQLAAYLGGKKQLRGWFVGQVMRMTQGKANPALVNELLNAQLEEFEGPSA